MTVFKAYDVRALYPDPLNELIAKRIGMGTAKLLMEESGKRGPIVVGYDMRPHSLSLVKALKDGMREMGADVIDVGLVDTPFVAFAVNHLNAIGGVQTTASHNPVNYNGFKICRAKAKPVGKGLGLEKIEDFVYGKIEPNCQMEGSERSEYLWDAYREHVFTYLDPKLLTGERLIKAAVDASNGMAGTMIPKLFRNIPGVELVEINFENDKGEFVHDPNPLVDANLVQTQDAVIKYGCDVGICFDGDADRCMVVDEKGNIVGCDLVTAWLAPKFLHHESDGGAIVYDLRSSLAVADSVQGAGGTPVKSRVGHVFMKQAMAEHDAPFGGELSGHFYFRDNFYADSGAMAFACVLSAVACYEGTMSEQVSPYYTYAQSGEINFENDDKEGAMNALIDAFPDGDVERLDGVTLTMPTWWCNVRASNTEPLLRLNIEAKTGEEVQQRVAEVAAMLGTRVDH